MTATTWADIVDEIDPVDEPREEQDGDVSDATKAKSGEGGDEVIPDAQHIDDHQAVVEQEPGDIHDATRPGEEEPRSGDNNLSEFAGPLPAEGMRSQMLNMMVTRIMSDNPHQRCRGESNRGGHRQLGHRCAASCRVLP